MVYNIFKDGYKINAIVSSAEFVDKYCILNGYTWEPVTEYEPEPEPTTEDRVAALEAENKTLKAQVSAQSKQMDFYEDCIAEMASVVYA